MSTRVLYQNNYTFLVANYMEITNQVIALELWQNIFNIRILDLIMYSHWKYCIVIQTQLIMLYLCCLMRIQVFAQIATKWYRLIKILWNEAKGQLDTWLRLMAHAVFYLIWISMWIDFFMFELERKLITAQAH